MDFLRRLAPVMLLLAGFVLTVSGCSGPDDGGERRVIILGFDGVEPTIVEEMMAGGELPNLAKLRDQGTFSRLESSNPPQSPTAWSSFTTSKHPGNHGIYDFLLRNPRTYVPGVGFGSIVHPKLAADGSLASPPGFKNLREGESFWKVASDQGARCKVFSVPFAFPADTLEEGCMLAGLGVPDLRGTTSTFWLMSDDFDEPGSLSGGKKLPLNFAGDTAKVEFEGARNPSTRKYTTTTIEIRADRDAKSLDIRLSDKTLTLKEGEWSEWVEWSFDVTSEYAVSAISRFHVLEVGEQVRLYMTCLQFHPRDPYMPFTSPEGYAAELADRYGFYKTIGWIYDTHALRQGGLTDDLFLDDIEKTMHWREVLTLDEMDRGNYDLLISAWTGTDRVGHMFWHHRDPKHPLYTEEGNAKYGQAVEDTYRRMDGIVGKVMERLGEDDLLMVLSDHGFHSFRRGFNVNTWLIRNGYLAVVGQTDPATAVNERPFLAGYDWSRSKAYSLGLGSVYLNLQGREGKGTVKQSEADALIAEIREKLLAVTDPKTGERVFSEIYTRDYYQGRATAKAPDLQLGYAEGYQSGKATRRGSAPADLFEDNKDKWSGDHAASDIANTPGIFFSNRPIASDSPNLVDLGVTALKYLGKEVPRSFEGKSLL